MRWLGVMWWGLAGTQWLLARRPHWLQSAPAINDNHGLAWRVLLTLGRWSLTFYMVHQPVMLGALSAALWAFSPLMPH